MDFMDVAGMARCLQKVAEFGRAIIIRSGEIIPMSSEFTPETERQRLQYLAFMQPHLLGNEFTHLEFPRRVQRKELGKKMLYRDFNMTGWAYKTIEDDDLKFPLIYGEGKKARVMATIGVTRGLGDHDLKVHDSNIYIKPFLSSAPERGASLCHVGIYCVPPAQTAAQPWWHSLPPPPPDTVLAGRYPQATALTLTAQEPSAAPHTLVENTLTLHSAFKACYDVA
ncbi:Protein phosphatase 1H [Galemys pyrenaicus]|uniref:Protein phosphatase 1H n=1 Tax=Galemys pyrenaicus TaxID=202257 RepID=A0A8J6AMD8_GALPY|nr:Protein phosphatase 1H [Galemys pyrenaicus]